MPAPPPGVRALATAVVSFSVVFSTAALIVTKIVQTRGCTLADLAHIYEYCVPHMHEDGGGHGAYRATYTPE